MEKMIVTQALDERDLLLKKINDAIARAKFVSVKKPNDEVILESKQKIADFESETKSTMQSIRDIIEKDWKRRNACAVFDFM